MSAVAGGPTRRRGMGRLGVGVRFGREPWLWVLVGATAGIEAAAAWLRDVHMRSGIDLAIFGQAVWHFSRFDAPFSSLKGEDLFGDHFHPLIAVLAPLYWIWSDPRTLL